MKPRIFIGSSTERLNIAYTIQEGLQYDALTTVWTQGIFQLSSNALDDLISALKNFDFAIFVFHADDVSKIRNQNFQTVRDNLIFELGLFIGRLGKDKVFFLIPENVSELHIPTDLLGVNPGKYDHRREDGNLRAALGPFCNQIRDRIKTFIFENLSDIEGENKEVKRIAIDKPEGWEFLFVAELLTNKLKEINDGYNEISDGLYIHRTKRYTGYEFFQWFRTTIEDYAKIAELFNNGLNELSKSFGPPGVSGKIVEMKNATYRLIQISKELLAWEFELQRIQPPEELIKAKQMMSGWSRIIIDKINELPMQLKNVLEKLKNPNLKDKSTIKINFDIQAPSNMQDILELFESYDYYNE